MNGYEINAAVKAAMAARQKSWLAGLGAGAEVSVKNYGSDTTVVVSRVTATQLVLSSGQRVNRDNGLIRGASGHSIYEPDTAEIEREEREKVTAAAQLLAERVAYSLSERREGRSNEPLAVGDAVVTADYYKRTGVVVHIYNNGGVIVDFSKERGQGTYAKSDLCKLLDPVATDAPASQSVNQAAATAITGISVADPDAGAANAIALTLSVPAGILTASNSGGVTVANSGTASIILNGTQASLNSFIAASHVSYTSAAGATGTVTLTIGSDDDGNSNLASTQLSVTNGTLNASLAGGATIGAGSSSPPRRRAPGAGRPRLVAPTKQVFGRIPASLLPELIKRGGVTRILIDALSKSPTNSCN